MRCSPNDHSAVPSAVSTNESGQPEKYMVYMLHCINHSALIKHLMHTRYSGMYRNGEILWYCSRTSESDEEASYDPRDNANIIKC